MQITINTHGNLVLEVDSEERAFIADALEAGNRFSIMPELCERFSCNGSFTPFDADDGNPFVGLTSAPCIAESMDIEDDGTRVIQGRFWYFAEYAIEDELEQLRDNGRTVFALAA